MIQAQDRPVCVACARKHCPDLLDAVRRRAALWHAQRLIEAERGEPYPPDHPIEDAKIVWGLPA
jgi:hypothetical protein